MRLTHDHSLADSYFSEARLSVVRLNGILKVSEFDLFFSVNIVLATVGTLSCTHSKVVHKVDIPAMDWPCATFPVLKYPLKEHEAENKKAEQKSLEEVYTCSYECVL